MSELPLSSFDHWRKTHVRQRPYGGGVEIYAVGDDLRAIDFSGRDLDDAILSDCDFSGCNMRNASMSRIVAGLSRFIGTDLSGAYLFKAEMTSSDLTRAILHNTRAVRVEWYEAVLREARIADSDLRRAWFYGTDLRQASLLRCCLEGASFTEAKVHGLDLTGSTGLEKAYTKSIDISPDGAPELLTGEEARAWLLRAAGQ